MVERDTDVKGIRGLHVQWVGQMRDKSREGKTGLGEFRDVEWGRELEQVREPGLPTSHLVPYHSVHHVHLTEEKRWQSWAHDSHCLRYHKEGIKVQRGYLSLSCTTS